jgi:flagellar motor switch protein FliN/FliY
VRVRLRVQLGQSAMRLHEVEALRPGAIVTLDRLAGEPVDVLCRGQCIALGEVMIQDDAFAVRVTEIVDRSKTDEARPVHIHRGRK